MKLLSISVYFTSLVFISLSQEKKLIDSSRVWFSDIFIGAEIGNALVAIIDNDRESYYDFFIKTYITKGVSFYASFGKEVHTYNKNNWNIDINGDFFKFGIEYGVSKNKYRANQYYFGVRYALSNFNQTINQYQHLVSNTQRDINGFFPTSTVITNWIELIVGAQVELFGSGLFLSAALTPRLKISEKTQNNSENIYTPGFGEDVNNRSFAFNWSVMYRLPL